MRKKLTVVLTVLTSLLLLVGMGSAWDKVKEDVDSQTPDGPDDVYWGRGSNGADGQFLMAEELNLSEKQINQIIDIQADLKKKQIPLKQKMHEMRLAEREERNSTDFDEKTVREMIRTRADLQADLRINHMQAVKKALDVLTVEQRAELGDKPIPFFGGGPGHPRFDQMGMGPGMGRGSGNRKANFHRGRRANRPMRGYDYYDCPFNDR